ncbi:MAG: SDR family oxidoreductase [Pseudomonadota bacterium]
MNVLITGANRGIGLALTQAMAARGDSVLAAARRDGPSGASIEPLTLDVTDEASLAALTQTLEDRALDLLVCNAGALIGRGGLEDPAYTHDAFAQVLAVNVTGVFMTVRACLPALRRAQVPAKIAIISSGMGSTARASGNAYLYRASKAAATNLAACMADELRGEGIAVAAYHPGWVRTDMGGASASVAPDASAAGLIQRFDALSLASTGCFETFEGQTLPF